MRTYIVACLLAAVATAVSAASKEEIDAEAKEAIQNFYKHTSAGRELAKKASGILSGLWDKVRDNPHEFLDERTVDAEGLDAATRDFLAGMTDRYAVRLFEQLYIPKPWAID